MTTTKKVRNLEVGDVIVGFFDLNGWQEGPPLTVEKITPLSRNQASLRGLSTMTAFFEVTASGNTRTISEFDVFEVV